MSFQPILLSCPIRVDRVVTVHYFEYSSSYYFEGERHDFWEFLYVDKGELDVAAGERLYTLRRGELIFHKPGEFHALRCNGAVAPNLVVVSFCCESPAMSFFEEKVLTVGEGERALLGRVVEEGEAAFSTPLNDPTTTAMERSPIAPFGAEQLLGAAVEELLVRLHRRGAQSVPVRPNPLSKGRDDLVDRVLLYLDAHVADSLTLAQVCADNLVGRSRLQQLFRARTGGGVMDQFGRMKIDHAKRMIREGRGNFTEIAAALGYQSIYYFSRHFKKVSGMTPSEYAGSVKMLSSKTRAGDA